MNTSTIAPEVQDFLAAVRAQLADLDPDEQREILDGLEADLTDLVAEHGGEALGDPVEYARELRTAAGLDPETRRSPRRVDLSAGVHSFLDDAHRLFDRSVAALPGDAAGVLGALQPAWWVLRAWIAVEIAAYFFGEWSLQVIPGSDVPGAIALMVAVVFSVQLGRGKLWPGDRLHRVAMLRVVLLGLNCFAVAMIPVVLQGLDHRSSDRYSSGFDLGYQQGARDIRESDAYRIDKAGLYADGKWVSNIYPYDAQGRPLVGVQLFNQVGEPINVKTQAECTYTASDAQGEDVRVYYPWTNGAAQTDNVFPVPSRVQASTEPDPSAFSLADPPAVGQFPLERVPSVSLPGVEPSKVRTAGGYTPGQRPDGPINGIDEGC
jgi:hypothetical protein